jgi:HSP20 family protein
MTRRPPTSATSARDPYGSSGGGWLDPFTQFRRMADQMDRWFDTFGAGRTNNRLSGPNDNSWAMDVWAPEIETFLRDDQFVIRMDLPGISKEDVNVEVTDDSVVIHGERQKMHEEDRDGYYRSERTYGRFYREVQLPDGAQPETAKANYRDGVLEVSVTAPPRQLARPRRVEIGSSSTTDRAERQRASSSSASAAESGTASAAASQPESSSAMPITDRTTHHDRSSVARDRGAE